MASGWRDVLSPGVVRFPSTVTGVARPRPMREKRRRALSFIGGLVVDGVVVVRLSVCKVERRWKLEMEGWREMKERDEIDEKGLYRHCRIVTVNTHVRVEVVGNGLFRLQMLKYE